MDYRLIDDNLDYFPDNRSDDGISYAPMSWSERQEQEKLLLQAETENQEIKPLLNMLKAIMK